ncbi:MAG TPA: SprB repeat-containing protein, partial [Chitinophagales bacterium]|nr:SprB repeat-containing protein [Chitinophagales bacterium]
MKHCLRLVLLFWGTVFYAQSGFSQCVPAPTVTFQNPSFEGPTGAGITPSPWTECMSGQTPDTQPGQWGVTLPPVDGTSYVGLVHQPSGNWQEGAAEPLSSALVAGTLYNFTVWLANSSSTGGGISPGCAECEIWGGFGPCDQGTLLWHSGDISPMDTWIQYNVSFTPTQNFSWIMFQVNTLGCSSEPYILVDDISPVVPSNVTATAVVNRNEACAGGSTGQATVHATGMNPPFTYTWSSGNVVNDTVLTNAAVGTYTVTVTDSHTCTSTASVTITEPAPLTLTPTIEPVTCYGLNTGSAYMSYAGGTMPMSFNWSNGPNTQNNSNLFAGTYNITVTDDSSCEATGSAIISQPPQLA